MPDIANAAYHPEKKSVGELLAMTNPAIIVPDWQRNYSWRSEHIDTFWNDLVQFLERAGEPITSEYFFGSIVLVSGADSRLLLLDGQQRLATSTILLAAIRDAIWQFDPATATWVQENYLADYDPISESHIHKLRLNVYDRDFFQRLISDKRTEDYTQPAPEHASHSLILSAKERFDRELAVLIADCEETESKRRLKRIVGALTQHFTVIAAFSDDEDSAAEVFETLNDRGIGLSTPDLLRNLIIRRAATGQQEQIVERWEDVIAFRKDNQIKTFFRHHWVSRYGDVKTQSLYREIKGAVEANNIDSLTLSTELSESAKLYQRLKSSDVDDDDTENMLDAINSFGAGGAILFPPLLSIFETLEGEGRKKAVTALLNVYVRDSVIGQIENSILENRFYKAARDLRKDGDVKAFCASLSELALPDDDVRNRFEGLSLRHNGQRRYILQMLEREKRLTSELDVAPPSKVHVEHIYPQKPAIGQRWAGHDRIINRLGNLTLLDRRINASIQNGTFAQKRPFYANSEINLTTELAELESWTAERVIVRQSELAGFVNAIWPLIE